MRLGGRPDLARRLRAFRGRFVHDEKIVKTAQEVITLRCGGVPVAAQKRAVAPDHRDDIGRLEPLAQETEDLETYGAERLALDEGNTLYIFHLKRACVGRSDPWDLRVNQLVSGN